MSFFVTLSLLLGSGYGYIAYRLIAPLELGGAGIAVGVLGVLSMIALSFSAMVLPFRFPRHRWPRYIAWAAYVLFGFLCLVATLLVLRDLGWALAGVFADTLPPEPGDRRWLLGVLNGIVLGAAGLLSLYGLRQARRTARVVRVDVPVADLHPDLAGFTIAQISDVHVGATIRSDYVRAIVERVNKMEPDLIAVTGDLVDGTVAQLREQVAPLAELAAAHGVYFVPGNHDYYSGARSWIQHVESLGMVALINEHRVIQPAAPAQDREAAANMVVGGVTDPVAHNFVPEHRSDPHRAMQGAPAADFRLLLAHQPQSVFAAEEAGFDLQICGHTHGGQFFPATIFVHFVQPYVAGLKRHGRMWIYVNRGTGYWGPPLRLNAPSEITLLTLVPA
ncbi:MAG: metallophosphoesterase [bacterium]|nr:metallophosphoesterase [bacterium]